MSKCTPAQRVCDVDGEAGLAVEERRESIPVLHRADELLSRSVDDDPLTGRTATETALLMQVARWAKDFLTTPHPALGRSGHVCPWVDASIREQRFLLTMLHDAATHAVETRSAIDETMLRLARYFLQLEPATGGAAVLRTIVVLFPDLPEQRASEIINGIHQRLKPYFVGRGLMLGEFFRDNSKPGLRNPAFRPLRSDTPLLVIRSMVPTDLAFLSDSAQFVEAFLATFQRRGRHELLSYVDEHRDSLADDRRAMLLDQVARFDAGIARCEHGR